MQATKIVGALLVAFLVSLQVATGQSLDDLDEELLGLELEDPERSSESLVDTPLLEPLLEAEPDISYRRYGHHHRGYRSFRGSGMPSPAEGSHLASLAEAVPANIEPKTALPTSADGQADSQPHILPSRHPAVERVLSSMDRELQELKAKKQAAGHARGHLQDMVTDAALHMNDAITLKHDIAKKEAKLDAQEERLKTLEASESRLERTHDHLAESLRTIMAPKVQGAEARLEKKQAVVQKMRQEVETWEERTENYKASALQMLKDRKAAKEGVEESEEAVAAAEQNEEKAEKALNFASKRADEKVEAYRYAQEKYNAARTRAQEGEYELQQSEKSVQKLRGIMDMEQGRIDQAMAIGKDKLQGKIRKIESNAQTEGKELEALKQEYAEWQKHQRGRVEQVAQAEAATQQLTSAFHNQQDQVLDAASDKVAKQAVDSSDWGWDNWPNAQDDSYNIDLGDSI